MLSCIVNGKHIPDFLEEIYCSGTEIDQDVVRWCTVCGAVVVDLDYDGRTNPGQLMKMRFPESRRLIDEQKTD
jgi:hypothetical protein